MAATATTETGKAARDGVSSAIRARSFAWSSSARRRGRLLLLLLLLLLPLLVSSSSAGRKWSRWWMSVPGVGGFR